jgi:hypothetical protein
MGTSGDLERALFTSSPPEQLEIAWTSPRGMVRVLCNVSASDIAPSSPLPGSSSPSPSGGVALYSCRGGHHVRNMHQCLQAPCPPQALNVLAAFLRIEMQMQKQGLSHSKSFAIYHCLSRGPRSSGHRSPKV